MKRNLKVLGLAVVAMLAMSVAAASASAASFTSPVGETDIFGEQTTVNVFKADAGEVQCAVAQFEGTAVGKEAASVVVNANYQECEAFGLEANVEMNGCQYELFAAGSADVLCPGANEIEVIAAFGLCTVFVDSQEGLENVGYTNKANEFDEVEVNVNIGGIAYEEEGFFCATNNQPTNNGTLTGDVLVAGFEAGTENQVDITHDP